METLLADPLRSHDDPDYRDKDRPVMLESFQSNVRLCKTSLGVFLAVSGALDIVHLVLALLDQQHWPRGDPRATFLTMSKWTDVVSLLSVAICGLLYLCTLIYPVTIRSLTLASMPETKHLALHRTLCQTLFLTFLLLLALHPLPSIYYTIKTHTAPPNLSNPYAPLVQNLRLSSLLACLVAVGCMRRGPKLYFQPPSLQTGFGLAGERHDITEGGVKIKLTPADQEGEAPLTGVTIDQQAIPARTNGEEETSNVFDYGSSSMLDFVFLSYCSSLAFRSMRVPALKQSDLPHMEEQTRNSGVRESVVADDHDRARRPTPVTQWQLVKALWSGKGAIVLVSLTLEIFKTGIGFIQLAAMREIIESFKQPPGSDKSYARLMCWGLLFGQSVEVLMSAYLNVRENYMLHIPIRMNLASMLLAKILRTADAKALEAHNVTEGNKQKNQGRSQVMNLLTIDTNLIASMAVSTWSFANGIITLIIGTGLLISMLGISAFVGIACVPLSFPLSYLVSKAIYRCDKEWARARDARTSALKEFLLGIKVIKLNAFEPYFVTRVQHLRENEVRWQRWRYTLGTLFNLLAEQLPILAMLITFVFHTKVLGRVLEPSTAFVSMSVFAKVKEGLSTFPQVIQCFLSTRVSLGRLCRFLSQPEIDKDRWSNVSDSILCDEADIAWPTVEVTANSRQDSETPRFCLRNISVSIPDGQVTLLCGPLGSGKTLLLRAFLREADIKAGRVLAPRSQPDATPILPTTASAWTIADWLNDSVAYAPQQSFVRHGTIRDNVVFGQPMWRERYREALRQADLLPDLEVFHDGDLTEVGENGVTLSGGQKARINLARCLYSRAKTVYLDDILSAVDAHTAQFICNECLGGSLLKNRTVILISHHVGLVLPSAQYVIALTKDGRVEQACPVSQIAMGSLETIPAVSSPPVDDAQTVREHRRSQRQQSFRERDASGRETRQLFKAEHMEVGRVATNHYLLVLKAAGGQWYWLAFAFLYLVQRGSTVARNFILEGWTGDSEPTHLNYWLWIYGAAAMVGILVSAARWTWLYGVGTVGFYSSGSKKIHEMVLSRVFGAPLAFFETTPHGRILNIFSQDIWRLDSQSADTFGRTSMQALAVLSSAAVVWFETPIIALVSLGFGIPFYWVSGRLNKLRAEVKRLAATASSPLFSLYNETIDGVIMVRAFGQNRFVMHAMKIINNRERTTWLAAWAVMNWVRAILRSASSIVVTATGFALVQSDMTPSKAGLILSFALSISTTLFGLLENYSAERINHYISMPDREPIEGDVPEPSWPSQGEIKVENLRVRYAPDQPEVLGGVSLHIEPGMRVGLVGATGSGKSTLALSLFRAVEAHAGSIVIDGIDIGNVALPELRRRLNMVAQDGLLNSGTLREVLDMTGSKDDHEIYEALRRVHLLSDHVTKDEVDNNPFANLDTYVAVEGANFSQGQRQLLCLARALLKQSRILVMDEATSSVDFEMDARITTTIRECFTGTTMLVIAHRLATIMSYDRVLVLDQGRIVESGQPHQLMRDPRGVFRGLCMAQGEEEFDKLLGMAEAAV
ncbi:hypothetical protein IAU60_003810 [Kwoniella sp. DSM 27419]